MPREEEGTEALSRRGKKLKVKVAEKQRGKVPERKKKALRY